MNNHPPIPPAVDPLAKDAAAAHRSRTEFLADLAHEIRTPMNAILGCAQLLQRDPTLPETVRSQIEVIDRNGQKLLTLMERLLRGDTAVPSPSGQGGGLRSGTPGGVAPETAPASQPARRVAVRLTAGAPACRVLVVDDEEDNRKLMLKLLRLIGFEAEALANGNEAVLAVGRWQPHLMIMDIRMPEMNGLEAIRRIRALPGGGALKIISLSAAVFPVERSEAIRSGADKFLPKPVQVDELLETIRHLLGLDYDYQPLAAGHGQECAPSSAPLSPPDLAALPAGLRQQLQSAVAEADFDEAHRLLQQLPTLDASLARRLGQLADAFDAEQLLQLLATDPNHPSA